MSVDILLFSEENMKTYASLLLIVASCLCVSNANAAYGGGGGSSGDPYLIQTPAQLNSIGATPLDWDCYFKLVANIDMSGYTGTSYNIIGNVSTHFTGGFDGNGYVISNLTYSATLNTSEVGMFGYTDHATIKNMRLENVNIYSNGSDIGGLIGYQYYGTVTDCSTTGSVSGGNGVGGLVGHQYGDSVSKILNCYSTASVTGPVRVGGLIGMCVGPVSNCYSTGNVTADSGTTAYIGGLIGDQYYATVSNCFTTGNVTGSATSYAMGGLTGNQVYSSMSNCYSTGTVNGGASNFYVGGLIGWQSESTITNCYSVGYINVSSTNNVGGLIGNSSTTYPSTITACFWDTDTSGKTDGVGNQDPDPSGVTGKTTAAMQTQSTFTSAGWDFSWTDGNPAVWILPVEGSTYPALSWQSGVYGGGSGTSGYPWKIYTLDHLLYLGNHPSDYNKYFILMNDIDMAGHTYSQAIIAPDTDNVTTGFQGTVFTGSFNGNNHRILNLTITDTTGRDYIGLFGYIGTAVVIQNLGVENVSISTSGTNSICIGALTGYLIGGSITNCHSTGAISASGNNSGSLGGLVGNQYTGTITTCYSTCSVTGGVNNHYLGGLIGTAHDNVTTCYSTGSIYAGTTSTYFGGLAGYHYGGTISNCYSTSAVTSNTNTRYAGGLIGASTSYLTTISTIRNCYSTGNVSTPGSYDIGGFVGYTTDIGTIITNCYARGSVTGDTRVAGLIGGNEATITNCYSTGAVSSWTYGGGMIGLNTGAVTNCFWDKNTSGWNYSAAGTGKTTAQMKTESTFTSAGWDFAWTDGDSADWVLWIEGQTYPTLAWQPATFGGGSGTPADPWKIDNAQHLLYLGYNSAYYGGSYIMTADIDMSAYTGTMYKVIGSSATKFQFTGDFDGGGHIISNLTYSTKAAVSNVGMFGYTSNATIQNLGLENEAIHSHGDAVGGLIGYQYRGHIYNCYTTGSVAGRDGVGGMVGDEHGSINNSYSTAYVTVADEGSGIGGLVGVISGYKEYGVRRCYSAGPVKGSTYVGGLIGYSNGGLVQYSFWDTQTSGQSSSAGGKGKTTEEMVTRSTFTDPPASWDFLGETANGTADIWRLCVNRVDYPRLNWESIAGDFACPDGVNLEDLDYLASWWLLDNCAAINDCDRVDLNLDGIVNMKDFAIFAENWLQGI